MMKVIANLGLCFSVYDIRSIDGGFIFPGDGASTYTVYFIIYLSGMLSKCIEMDDRLNQCFYEVSNAF